MKKTIILVLSLTVFFSGSAFAGPGPELRKKMEKNFYRQFPKADRVKAESFGGITTVSFVNLDRKFVVVYDEEGEQIGEGRYLSADELPLKVRRSLEERFGEFAIQEALEFSPKEDLSYYCARIITTKKIIVVKVFPDGYVEVYKKEKRPENK